MEHKKSNHSWDEEEIKKILRTVSRGRGDPAGVRDREYAEIYKNANDR